MRGNKTCVCVLMKSTAVVATQTDSRVSWKYGLMLRLLL